MENPHYLLYTYLLLLLIYHLGEFLLHWYFHRNRDFRALLISPGYLLAQTLCFAEWFWGRSNAFQWSDDALPFFGILGLLGSITGLAIRFSAIITAGVAFTHQIQENRRKEHELVQKGLYRYFRHPGYLGWMMWVLSSQVLLGNTLCLILFALWTWWYFRQRISYEEEKLISFFGEAYQTYRKSTPSGIPLIP
jgi:protein-S-isoprenylcysteine O-methyltransferase